MRGPPHPQRSMLAIVDPGNGYPGSIRCDGLRPWVVAGIRPHVRLGGPGLGATGATAEASLLIALYSVRSERAFCEEPGTTCPVAGSWTWT